MTAATTVHTTTIHATAIVVGERGILIRGAAGSGKSSLAEALILAVATEGRFAALVADDRVQLEACAGRLLARPHPAIAGLIELRGAGLVGRHHVGEAVLHLCVDLDPDAPRHPEETIFEACGIARPRIVVNRALAYSVTRWRLRSLDDAFMIVR